MATIHTIVSRCPYCGQKLSEVTSANQVALGSPIHYCRTGARVRDPHLVEWYDFPHKWHLWGWPLILGGIGFLVGCFGGNPALGAMCGMFMVIIGIFISLSTLFKMLESKSRMNDPKHVAELIALRMMDDEQISEWKRKHPNVTLPDVSVRK